jgi:hypothetical protein
MLEFAKGSEGELRLGREQVTDNFEGIDLVLQTLLVDDREPYGKSWQYALGRLVVLDSLLRDFSTEFLFDHLSTQEYERTMMALDFGFRHLLSSHTNVCKMARKVIMKTRLVLIQTPVTFAKIHHFHDSIILCLSCLRLS